MMRLWQVPFHVGHRDDYVHCLDCNREFIVRRVTIMSKLHGKEMAHCIYCGSDDIVVEDVEKEEKKV